MIITSFTKLSTIAADSKQNQETREKSKSKESRGFVREIIIPSVLSVLGAMFSSIMRGKLKPLRGEKRERARGIFFLVSERKMMMKLTSDK